MNNNLQNQKLKNYNEAYDKLSKSNVNKNWYYDEETNKTGLIWHFTDINNMANILSYSMIASKNYCEQRKLSINDNASSKVNDVNTQNWVHNYARFYLRPKTPTQYRNQGIFAKTRGKDYTRRVFKNNKLWEDKPAHLPVPVFITFSLKEFLKKGGYITKHSLAGKNVSETVNDEIDKDLSNFKNQIKNIYSDGSESKVENRIKQTEFIKENFMEFDSTDVIKIFVRTEIEKLILLTLLAERNAKYFTTKEEHQKIDIQNYIDKIIVEPDLFYNDAGVFTSSNKEPKTLEKMYPWTLENVCKKDYRIEEKPYEYVKENKKDNWSQTIEVQGLKKEKIVVTDINNEKKDVGVIHKPDWILDTNFWRQKKYYTRLYYHGKYLPVVRNFGENEWFINDETKKREILNLTTLEKELLRQVEESYHKVN